MSTTAAYDYNLAVQTFQEARRNAALAFIQEVAEKKKKKEEEAAVVVVEAHTNNNNNNIDNNNNNNSSNDNHQVRRSHRLRRNSPTTDTTAAATTTTATTTTTTLPRRRQDYLQCAVETMERLSTHCPLTPLLWIQYGRSMYEYYQECCSNTSSSNTNSSTNTNSDDPTTTDDITIDIAAGQLEYQTLQLGRYEFPGAAWLQFRIVVVQIHIWIQQQQQRQQQKKQLSQQTKHINHEDYNIQPEEIDILLDAIRTTIQQIGVGSHRNEDYIIVLLYRLQITLLLFQWHLHQQDAPVLVFTTTSSRNNHSNNQSQLIPKAIYASVLQRSKCPMRTMNQNLVQEIQTILQQSSSLSSPPISLEALMNDIEFCRQYEARTYQPFIFHEDAMEQSLYEKDHITLPRFVPHLMDTDRYEMIDTNNNNTTTNDPHRRTQYFIDTIQSLCQEHIHWEVLFRLEPTNTLGMGLGSVATAQICINYVKAIKQHLLSSAEPKNPDGDISIRDVCRLIVSVYERGIAECPCIELLWLSYIRELQSWIQHNSSTIISTTTTTPTTTATIEPRQQLAMERLVPVTQRALRNCPYSIAIVQQQFESILLVTTMNRKHYREHRTLTTTNTSTLSNTAKLRPEQLLTLLQEALDLGFLSLTGLVDITKIFFLPIQILKRHLLILLSEQHQKELQTTLQVQGKEKLCKKHAKRASVAFLYYDDGEHINHRNATTLIPSVRLTGTGVVDEDDYDTEIMDEIEGLVEDMDEIYIQIEKTIGSYMTQQTQSETSKAMMTTSKSEVYSMLYQEHAQTELLLLHPLRRILIDNDDDDNDRKNRPTTDIMNGIPILQLLEKSIRFANPPHPDLYHKCIQNFMFHRVSTTASLSTTSKPYDVLCHIRQIRGLYVTAISAVGRSNNNKGTLASTEDHHHHHNLWDKIRSEIRDYETSLQCLCQDWLNFERIVGSPRSYGKASILVEKKLQKVQLVETTRSKRHTDETTYSPVQPVAETGLQQQQLVDPMVDDRPSTTQVDLNVNDMKRQRAMIAADIESEVVSQPVAKKLKANEIVTLTPSPDLQMDRSSDSQTKDPHVSTSQHEDPVESTTTEITAVKVRPKILTVRVGNMDYPVHMYTIRVSNLSPDTEDMDLVDTFRRVCGAIVHARIVREKHADGNSRGASKGYGLIQFEQLESVEKALALDDTLGIHEKLVKVERSHIPAVSLIPPGMHRVRPKGEGKVSKRNEKRSQLLNQNNVSSASAVVKGTATIADQSGNVDSSAIIPDKVNDATLKQQEHPVSTNPVMSETNLTPTTKPSSGSVTAFRPRTVQRGHQHPKPKLKLK